MPIDHKKNSTILSQRGQYDNGGVGRWYWDYRDKKIFSLIGERHKRILDAGCGEGITLEKMIATFPEKEIRGIDVVDENVKICLDNGLPAEKGSVYNLTEFKDNFDLCVLSEVVEHLEDVDLALRNIKQSLAPGGELIIVFPNDRNFKIARLLFLKLKEAYADPGHLYHFTPASMNALLKKNDFTSVKTINTPFFFWPFCLHSIILAKKND